MKPQAPLPTPTSAPTPSSKLPTKPPTPYTTLPAQNKRLHPYTQTLRARLAESERGRKSYRQNNVELVQRVVQLKREREGLREERKGWVDGQVQGRVKGRRGVCVDGEMEEKRRLGEWVLWVVVGGTVVLSARVGIMVLLASLGWCEYGGLGMCLVGLVVDGLM
jgi:hypothetical protein